MLQAIRKMFALFLAHERRQFYLVIGIIIVMALLELVGIGSILPFLTIATKPDLIQSNRYLHWLFEHGGFQSTNHFLLAVGGLTILVLAFTQAFNAFAEYMINRFSSFQMYSLSVRVFYKYLHHPYLYFLNHNSSRLNRMILSEVQHAVGKVLIAGMELLAKSITSIAIISLLVAFDPKLAITAALVLGGAYLLIFLLVKNKLIALGKARVEANGLRFKLTAEAFGGIKHIKLVGRENIFVQAFCKPAQTFAHYQIYTTLIEKLPHHAISIIAFSGILLVTMYFIAMKQNFQQALPVIGLYALAGYRLLPAIRGIYSGITHIRSGLPSVDLLYADLSGEPIELDAIPSRHEEVVALPFTTALELRDITFGYANASAPIFQQLNLHLPVNTSVGLAGATGCGKTTLVDLILGLLEPQAGELLVDGVRLEAENLRNWQRNLGYVPQQIFLSDDTVARNIAFGVPEADVDMPAVEAAARIANLHEFVVQELPHGYDTIVGERGIRLSGGQRQRIGIARALYYDPSFLIFDEATSALDNLTENAVMDALNTLAGQKTIIIIAHRLTTVKTCDIIYLMEKGKIIAQGDYDTLLHTSADFQKMANIM